MKKLELNLLNNSIVNAGFREALENVKWLNNLTELSLNLKNNWINSVELSEIMFNLDEVNINCQILVDLKGNVGIGLIKDYLSG